MEVSKDMLLSIIIPVYNAEKVIGRCIDSIINEVDHNTEIVIVDDGSTDNSYEVCKGYESQYDFIRIIHKENEGVSVSRNVGIENARGKYIFFLDADDWLEKGWSNAICKFQSEDWDMVAFAYRIVYPNSKKDNTVSPYETGSLSTKDVYRTLASTTYMNFCWGKLLSNQFVKNNNIKFPVGKKIGEDVDFQIDILENNAKMFYCDFPIVNYYQEPNSVMHRFSKSKFGALEQEYSVRNHLLKKSEPSAFKPTEEMMFVTLGGILISYVKQSCEHFSKEEAISLFSVENEKEYFRKIVNRTKFLGKQRKNIVFLMKSIVMLFIKAKKWNLLYSVFRRR